MGMILTAMDMWKWNRERTIGTMNAIAELPDPQEALGWRPGPGRAHIAWQLLHVGITEELFATERLRTGTAGFAELVPRFRGGSTPDDNIPTVAQIHEILSASRQHLLETVQTFQESDLETIPEPLKQRGWTIGTALKVINWHEAHHQGQAHITLNLYKNRPQG